jgi:CRISPR type IV-associated protein Csf3
MDNLQIIAHMATPLVAYDDWSPSFDALIEYQLLDQLGLITPNPTAADAEKNLPLIFDEMPIARKTLKGEWYWAVSSPHYIENHQQTQRYRKRWDKQELHLDWGKKKAKVDSSQGHFKAYDLPRYDREMQTIHWFAIGNADKISELILNVTNLGKKRSQGCGQVHKWEVLPFEHDWHLWRGESLARPMPINMIPQPQSINMMNWGWRTPYFVQSNRTMCYMPTDNVWRE